MEITGKLTKLLPVQTGAKKDGGDWQRQTAIIETNEQYPKTIAVDFWADKVEEIEAVELGSFVKMFINIESREYNDKYFTNVKCYKIEIQSTQTQPASQTNDLPF